MAGDRAESCSFCGKPAAQAGKLIAGPGGVGVLKQSSRRGHRPARRLRARAAHTRGVAINAAPQPRARAASPRASRPNDG
ncbi:MAG: ClpX C4-type zinc finger protein, partial [Opitutales bacterium]